MTCERRPLILVVSCGGTISSVRSAGSQAGVCPRLGAADLVADIPELGTIADLEMHTFSIVPSSDLTLDDVLALRAFSRRGHRGHGRRPPAWWLRPIGRARGARRCHAGGAQLAGWRWPLAPVYLHLRGIGVRSARSRANILG